MDHDLHGFAGRRPGNTGVMLACFAQSVRAVMTSRNAILRLPPTAERSEHAHGSSRSVRPVSVEFILRN